MHKDPELADALASLALGDEVPEELWMAVAEVLAWAYAPAIGCDYPKGVIQEIRGQDPIQALSVSSCSSLRSPSRS